MFESHPPTCAEAWARIQAIDPEAYARSRNALTGAVTGLSPYITHGFVSMSEVLNAVVMHHALPAQHLLVFEFGWRAYFHHVWQHRGDAIFQSLHEGPLPDDAYARELPDDIRLGQTGVPVVDMAVRTLYATGWLHNHARMWLASYVVHVRKVFWRVGADWLYGHLLDGDLASNHLSWQWVAGTGSSKPYLFNADNVARFAPLEWHSPGTVIDTTYEALGALARTPGPIGQRSSRTRHDDAGLAAPLLRSDPPQDLKLKTPNADDVRGREVWLVHPWSLGELPADLPRDALVLGLYVADFHRAWPWSEKRWRFVDTRMRELMPLRWWGDADAVGQALTTARQVRCVSEPHLDRWLKGWAQCEDPPVLFPPVDQPCASFSKWWSRALRGVESAADLLAAHGQPEAIQSGVSRPIGCEAVIPAQAGIQSVAAGQAVDANRHISGFQPARE
jgi:deoxyribodipyrimidine photo-lyase